MTTTPSMTNLRVFLRVFFLRAMDSCNSLSFLDLAEDKVESVDEMGILRPGFLYTISSTSSGGLLFALFTFVSGSDGDLERKLRVKKN